MIRSQIPKRAREVFFLMGMVLLSVATIQGCVSAAANQATARIVWVNPAERQSTNDENLAGEQQNASAILWHDDFDSEDLDTSYYETAGERSAAIRLGASGSSLKMHYPAGEHGTGGRKLLFGDAPFGNPIHSDKKFSEVYWRVYLYHPVDWQGGGPEKLSRVTSFVSKDWNQASVLHVWDGAKSLNLDPVSSVSGSRVLSKKYNDFANFRWLGNAPESSFPLYGAERGRWVSVEAHARLNTPGVADGYGALWIDGLLQIERKNLDFRGSYTSHGLNALFLEAYSNQGLAITQSRYLDNFVVSTEKIGPILADSQPLLQVRLGEGSSAYQVEVGRAVDFAQAKSRGGVVRWKVDKEMWQSRIILPQDSADLRVVVSKEMGRFNDALGDSLPEGGYVIRIRERVGENKWSDWSPWHQPFRVSAISV